MPSFSFAQSPKNSLWLLSSVADFLLEHYQWPRLVFEISWPLWRSPALPQGHSRPMIRRQARGRLTLSDSRCRCIFASRILEDKRLDRRLLGHHKLGNVE